MLLALLTHPIILKDLSCFTDIIDSLPKILNLQLEVGDTTLQN